MKNKTYIKKDYKLIIFDFDGTLVDSVSGIHKTANIMAKKYRMKSISLKKVKNAVGAGLGIFLQKIFKKVINKYGLKSIKKDYVELYRENFKYKLKIFPSVLQVLKVLRKKRIKMIILSNKLSYFIKKSCQYAKIDKFFNEIIGRGDLKKDKPDSYPVNYIANKYKINKKNILLVGDSQYDAECAIRSKIDFFYLNYGYGDKYKMKKFIPAYTKEKISDLLDIIYDGHN